MQREEKSERSRRAVLDAALYLFSHQGFRGTTIREIAERADVSTGNVYHHFPDKEAIFRALIDEFLEVTGTQQFPFTRVLRGPDFFPDNIEELGFAARDSVRQFRNYLALMYVDGLEFNGTHIEKFYASMGERFARYFAESPQREQIDRRLRPEVSPASALLLTTRLFFNLFTVEIVFGVTQPVAKRDTEVVAEIADIIRNGICAK